LQRSDEDVESDGYESSAFSKRFGRYLERCGVKTNKRLVFHSFRHTIKDLLRESSVDRSVQDAICGHDDGSVQASYGAGYSPKRLHEELHKIKFSIDLDRRSIPPLGKN
jgi:integrase